MSSTRKNAKYTLIYPPNHFDTLGITYGNVILLQNKASHFMTAGKFLLLSYFLLIYESMLYNMLKHINYNIMKSNKLLHLHADVDFKPSYAFFLSPTHNNRLSVMYNATIRVFTSHFKISQ